MQQFPTCPFLLKSACAFSSRTMMMSPGSSPGSWSPSPEKVTFCPSSIPLSTDTSRIFLSRFTFRPLHFLHLGNDGNNGNEGNGEDAPELGVDSLPLSVALAAHRLDLLHHTRPKLLDSHLYSSHVNIMALYLNSVSSTHTPACRSPCSWDTFGQLQVFPRSPHSRRR